MCNLLLYGLPHQCHDPQMNMWSKRILPILASPELIPKFEFFWGREWAWKLSMRTAWELQNKIGRLDSSISILFVEMGGFPTNTLKTKYTFKHYMVCSCPFKDQFIALYITITK